MDILTARHKMPTGGMMDSVPSTVAKVIATKAFSVGHAVTHFGDNPEMTDRHKSDTEELLAKVIVGMTISLDGFVADQNGNAGRIYPDLAALRYTPYMKDAIEQTGAVLMRS